MPHESVTRAEVEFNHGWMLSNPALFAEQVIGFQTSYPYQQWQHQISMHRDGFVTFIAHRRQSSFVEAQYLTEIGMARG